MSQRPALKGLKQVFPLRLCHQNHLGNLEKYTFLGPSQRHRFRHWGGRLVTLIQWSWSCFGDPHPIPPQTDPPAEAEPAQSSTGWGPDEDPRAPNLLFRARSPRTRQLIFRVGRALPGSPFTKGTRRVPVPGRHRGGPAEPGEGPEPPRALARSRGHSGWAAGPPAPSPGPTPSSCSPSGRREGRAGSER